MRRNRPAQVQPDAGHAQPVDRATPRPDASAGVKPAAHTDQRRLQDVQSQVQDLAARVDDLEQAVVPPQPPVDPFAESQERAPRQPAVYAPPQTAVENQAASTQTRLQDVLPEVKDLAQKVGGLEQLSRIVDTLKQTKE